MLLPIRSWSAGPRPRRGCASSAAALLLDHLAGQVQRRAHAGAAVAELAGFFATEAMNRRRSLRRVGRGHQHQRLRGDQADGRKSFRLYFTVCDQRRSRSRCWRPPAGCSRRARRRGDLLRADGATGAAEVLDHHRLAQPRRESCRRRSGRPDRCCRRRGSRRHGDGAAGIVAGGEAGRPAEAPTRRPATLGRRKVQRRKAHEAYSESGTWGGVDSQGRYVWRQCAAFVDFGTQHASAGIRWVQCISAQSGY